MKATTKPNDLLLKMMNLILILVIPMVPCPEPKIRQPLARSLALLPLLDAYCSAPIRIEQLQHLPDDVPLLSLGDVACGVDIFEAVGAADFGGIEGTGSVEVVEMEERGGVEGSDVVFFCLVVVGVGVGGWKRHRRRRRVENEEGRRWS